jgi:hypothetical protein
MVFIGWRDAANDGRKKRSREYVVDRVLVYKHALVALVLFEECMKRVVKRRLKHQAVGHLMSVVRQLRNVRDQHVSCITDRHYLQYGLDTIDAVLEELSNDWQISEDSDIWIGCTMLFNTRRNFKRILETTTLDGLCSMIALENPLNVSTVSIRLWCMQKSNYQGYVMIDLKQLISALPTLDLPSLCDEIQRYTMDPVFTHTLVDYVIECKKSKA